MADARRARLVKLIVDVQATDADLLDRVGQLLSRAFGPSDQRSTPRPVQDPPEPEKQGSWQQFLSFATLLDPGRLPEARRLTAAIEKRLAADCAVLEGLGPAWIDPGYLTAGKVIRSHATDDHDRIYVADGVFAQIVMRFADNQWTPRDGAGDGYRTESEGFFRSARDLYLEQLNGG